MEERKMPGRRQPRMVQAVKSVMGRTLANLLVACDDLGATHYLKTGGLP
jgi:hypothetical protein